MRNSLFLYQKGNYLTQAFFKTERKTRGRYRFGQKKRIRLTNISIKLPPFFTQHDTADNTVPTEQSISRRIWKKLWRWKR